MYYQYTGQPGHGKTVLAIEFALDMKAKADRLHEEDPTKHPVRELYVCNVRDFNHGAAGALELTPAEVQGWHDNSAFDHAIILIDEAYEHGMFPRRPPGRPVPEHVQQVAKHRHRGIDFIMICQSPKKQMDDFLHDLIEEHYHIRRRYGLPFVHVKRWDKFEPNPEKALPLTTTRRSYPKRVFRLYTSTKYDTSEKRVPWFYWAAGALLVGVVGGGLYAAKRVDSRIEEGSMGSGKGHQRANGAPATVATPGAQVKSRGTPEDYVASFTPRVPGQPWSAPAYDAAGVADPPRLFCMVAGPGQDARGNARELSCSCMTEQGTRYELEFDACAMVARNGQYEPFLRQARQQQAQPGAVPGQASGGLYQGGSDRPGSVIGRANRAVGSFPENEPYEVSSYSTIQGRPGFM